MKRVNRELTAQTESEQYKFGVLLHKLRGEKMITQLDLAVNVGRSPSDISRWEKGIRKSLPDRNTVIALANSLKLSVSDKNRLLQAAGYEIPVSDKGVDLANPAIMKIVDMIASTEMPPDRMRAFEKDICGFVETWKKYIDLSNIYDDGAQEKGYRALLDVEFPNIIDGFRIRLSHALGKSYKHQGRFQEAIQWYKQALFIANRINNQNWMAELESCLGDACRDMNESIARQHYKISAQIFDEMLNDKVSSVRNRRKLASVDLLIGTKTTDFDSLVILNECKQELENLLLNKPMETSRQQIKVELCQTLYLIGWTYSLEGKAKKGIEVRQEGLQLANELKNEYLITQGYHYLGDDYDNIDELDGAEENYRNALAHCIRIENPRRRGREESNIYRGLGSTLAKQDHRRKDAQEAFKNSLNCSPNDNRLIAMNQNEYGVFLTDTGDILSAIDALNDARNLFEVIGNKYYRITATMNLVEAYCKKGDLVTAKKHAESALIEARKIETTRLIIPALEKYVYIDILSVEESKGALDELKEFGELCSQIRDTNSLDGNKRILTSRVTSLIELKLYDKAIGLASSLIDFFEGSKDPIVEDFRRALVEARIRAATLKDREEKTNKNVRLPDIENKID